PLEQHVSFQNPYVKALDFDDQNGRPKFIITPGEPGLNFYPQLAEGGETFVAGVVKPASAPAQGPPSTRPATPQPGAPSAAPPGAKPPAPPAQPAPPPLPAIVLDAGHGGSDSGARSRDGVLEKNVVAQIAAKAAAGLASTKKYRVILTRSGDADPSIEQRTLTANTSEPAVFVTFHAGDLGDRSPVAAVYTYEQSSPPAPVAPHGGPSSLFVRWNMAQQPQLTRSQQLAAIVQQRLAQIQGVTAPAQQQAPVRQLRSIAAPAVAVEVGTLAPDENAGLVNSAQFQQQIAGAIAAALQQFVPAGAAK
ncbi:MAG: N-acetylmuramoyl-L-alanine amidase family protein, partial [Terriglobia bacterium]